MLEPKTPLPWGTRRDEGSVIADREGAGQWTGYFDEPEDAAYAVHAANVLPEVLAALRGAVALIREIHPFGFDDADAATEEWRLTLAKAEGAPCTCGDGTTAPGDHDLNCPAGLAELLGAPEKSDG